MATTVSQKDLNEKFNKLKDVLSKIKGAEGGDLFTHLQQVFRRLILHYPDQALEKLEEVSYLTKNASKLNIEDFLKLSDVRNYKDLSNEMKSYIAKMKAQFGGLKPQGEDEDEEPAEVPPVGLVQDLLEDAIILQWAGVGFGKQELYRLQKSLKKLATDSGASQLRFFGKIRGT
jgi:hypothetical protein